MQFINAYQFSTLIYTLYITPAAPDKSLPPCPKARLKSPSPRALLLGVHVGHDGPNFAQNVGPAKSRHQHDDCAGGPFEDVPGMVVQWRDFQKIQQNGVLTCVQCVTHGMEMLGLPSYDAVAQITATMLWPDVAVAHRRHGVTAKIKCRNVNPWPRADSAMGTRKIIAPDMLHRGNPLCNKRGGAVNMRHRIMYTHTICM